MRIRVFSKWLTDRIPSKLKSRIRAMPLVYILRNVTRRYKYSSSTHEEIYDAQYFTSVDRSTTQAAEVVASSIIERFSPRSALDIGCGTGALLSALQSRGVSPSGIDCSEHALKYCQQRSIPCRKMDLCHLDDKHPIQETFDVAICMEVAHQLPKAVAGLLVKLLTGSAPAVVFSSERPGTFDRLPLNEQPPEYWVALFQEQGFQLDQETTTNWRALWSSKELPDYFCRNTLVFARSVS